MTLLKIYWEKIRDIKLRSLFSRIVSPFLFSLVHIHEFINRTVMLLLIFSNVKQKRKISTLNYAYHLLIYPFPEWYEITFFAEETCIKGRNERILLISRVLDSRGSFRTRRTTGSSPDSSCFEGDAYLLRDSVPPSVWTWFAFVIRIKTSGLLTWFPGQGGLVWNREHARRGRKDDWQAASLSGHRSPSSPPPLLFYFSVFLMASPS